MGAVFQDGESDFAEAGEQVSDGVGVEGDILGDLVRGFATGGASEDLGAEAGAAFGMGILGASEIRLLFGREPNRNAWSCHRGVVPHFQGILTFEGLNRHQTASSVA
jgi:hypothetical protein